jgi:transposase-like protein
MGNRKRWGDNSDKRASARLMAAAGQSSREIAAELGVNQSTVVRWMRG